MLKIAIIGCGKIADQHADEIQIIPNCELVGVCDAEELMAKQLYERFRVKQYFSDARRMLEVTRPDVVHITTPAQSHFELGKLCLESDCHVYMEKPFTLTTEEAKALIDLAKKKNRKITAGHNAQFTPAVRKLRDLVKDGYLGSGPVHMESYYNYNLSDSGYAKALLGDKNHWVRKLPGKLLHNIISHGISRMAEYLTDDSPLVIAHGHTSELLRSIGETEIVDELRVIIYDSSGCTAYFTFSSQMRPVLHQFRIYGSKNSIMVDDDQQIVIKLPGEKYKSYLDQVVTPYLSGRQYLGNALHNIRSFFNRSLYMNSGMRYLIRSFYRSVSENGPLPMSYKEILLTSRIMDEIFSQVAVHETKTRGSGINEI